MRIFSPAFDDGDEIPCLYTCVGEDIPPPLAWEGLPEDTKSLTLIADDPDAPDPEAPKMTWIHWLLYNIPPSTEGLPEEGTLPSGTMEGTNSWSRKGYGGPCPPIGRHRYFFKLYALERELPDLNEPDIEELLSAMEGSILARAELVGTYEK